jgi:Lrp/AsnC family transcriptional regulator for asnA, asnC and gidA
MAPLVGLSAPAVRLRVQRLVDAGVLAVVGVTDPMTLGFGTMAMIGVQTTGDVRVVADAIGALPNVVYLVLVAGEHDLLVEVVCRDADELLTVVNDRIRATSGVVATRVWQYYGIHTHRFTWGVPDA